MTQTLPGYVLMQQNADPTPSPTSTPAPQQQQQQQAEAEFPPRVPEPWIYSFGRIAARPFSDLWFDLKVYGVHKVPSRGWVLIVSNHQSFLDPMLFACKLPPIPGVS